ncbi:excisionase family DNA binding protein [Anaerobacterium chartisolvens]|uniref:Excisionase family DNA binding protein n=1 Tax=Anaerobacterium chartisolvens TaxID=1297424 RepID=A0A369BBY0_9FIRM|nr:methyltransferase domain-containing protein [Anaerobacterium chartisolvens]RCX17164.1 excisionase family DNA binding protein [Anaerobacterium chartisolvens]
MHREILNMEEAAELFGVSVKTFIKLLKEESVPARKIGREWRFSRKALIEWLSSGDSKLYSGSEGETKEFFNQVAAQWEELRKGYYDDEILKKLLDMELLKSDMTVVDLGAGDGYISISVAPRVKKVIAVDISQGMLKELEKKAFRENLKNIDTVLTDGGEISLEDSSVDMVCASMVLHHIEEPEASIEEMYRVIKPGGSVFVLDFVQHGDRALMEKMHDKWPGFDVGEMEELFMQAGFRDIKIEKDFDCDGASKGKGIKGGKKIFILTAVK